MHSNSIQGRLLAGELTLADDISIATSMEVAAKDLKKKAVSQVQVEKIGHMPIQRRKVWFRSKRSNNAQM